MKAKNISTILVFLISTFIFSSPVLASNPSFSLYPSSGIVVDAKKGFSVDIRLDTDGEKASSARFTVLFDPRYLKLIKAERNTSLFDQWPEDETSIDNDNGVVMLTGFTQSADESDAYITEGEFDVIARLTFEAIKEGTTTIDWEYDTNNGIFDTYIMRDGSPPINMLMSKPSGGKYIMGSGGAVLDPGTINTAVEFDWRYVVVTGVVMLLFGGFMIFTRPEMYRRRKGTVVIIGDDEKR